MGSVPGEIFGNNMSHACIREEEFESLWKKINSYVNGNVKWHQLIPVTVALLGIIVTLCIWGANAVIANDRMRASEDLRIEQTWGPKLTEMQADIREIKTILKIKNEKF